MFDPSLPADNTKAKASEMRDQFNALKALIDTLQSSLAAQSGLITTMQSQISTLQAQVTGLMNDTPHNCASVGDLSLTLSNPTQSFEVQQLIDKINELLGVLRR